MGWLITLGILVLFAICPLGIGAVYDDGGLLLRLLAGSFRIPVYPTKKEKKSKRTVQKKTTAAKTNAGEEKVSKQGGSLTDFLPLVQLALDFLGDFRRKLRVKRLELLLIMAGDDPCDLAVNYGKAWAAVGNLMPQLERIFKIKKRDVHVACDFTAVQTRIYAKADITITLGRLLGLVAVYGIKAICEYSKISNSRKGGAAK